MKNFIALAFATIFATSAFAGSSIHPTTGETRDLNPWGHASMGFCSTDSYYDARIGGCIVGDMDYVSEEGYITPSRNEKGVTTGFVFTTKDNKSFPISLPQALKASFEDNAEIQETKLTVSVYVIGDVVEAATSEESKTITDGSVLIFDQIEDSGSLPEHLIPKKVSLLPAGFNFDTFDFPAK